jgi:putative lipoprotein (rSAM/lipoprotein system)
MKIIKYKCLKTYNALIVLLISFLGFASSCDSSDGIQAMYGTPSADFIVKGKVGTATNSPVAGIKVEMSTEVNNGTEKVSYLLNTTSSAESTGTYKVTGGQFPETQTFKIKFTDIDGALNGEYETLDTVVVFQDPKFTGGDGNWYYGQTEQEINIKLKPKK